MAPRLVEYGYFYDALSGEFLPPSDPIGRKHTLARLLGATFEKGEVTDLHSWKERRAYTPSWAPISSVVEVSNDDFICALDLRGEESALRVVHKPDENHYHTVQVFTDGASEHSFEEPLLGRNHVEIQAAVGELAQKFFNTLPPAQRY